MSKAAKGNQLEFTSVSHYSNFLPFGKLIALKIQSSYQVFYQNCQQNYKSSQRAVMIKLFGSCYCPCLAAQSTDNNPEKSWFRWRRGNPAVTIIQGNPGLNGEEEMPVREPCRFGTWGVALRTSQILQHQSPGGAGGESSFWRIINKSAPSEAALAVFDTCQVL